MIVRRVNVKKKLGDTSKLFTMAAPNKFESENKRLEILFFIANIISSGLKLFFTRSAVPLATTSELNEMNVYLL